MFSKTSVQPGFLAIRIFFCFLFLISTARFVAAQDPLQPNTTTNRYTPEGLQAGAPAGAYPLSGFDNINLFNRHLSFYIPIVHIGGRGSAGYTVMKSVQQRWSVYQQQYPTNCGQGGCTDTTRIYNYAYGNNWNTIEAGYGAGVLVGRGSGWGSNLVSGCFYYTQTLTRLTFIEPDGTEHELRDTVYWGEPKPPGGSACTSGGGSRGTTFVSADGTSMTFISDAVIYDNSWSHTQFYPSGYLYLRDGTRLRIANGFVTAIRDRQGNTVTLTYSTYSTYGLSKVTDSMGREINFGAAITFKGVGGVNRQVSFNGAPLSKYNRRFA